jgi:hypothetical protein
MSTPVADSYVPQSVALPEAALPSSRPEHTRFSPRRWMREPLLHFVILGGLLFAVDYWLIRNDEDPNTIIVSAQVTREAIQTFQATRGRAPNAEELEALQRIWLDNEVLYREGLALGVDKGDTAIRERVIFKALSVVDSNVKLPSPDENTLRAWFESHREKYDEPARFDFEEAALSGTATEAAVREFVATLNSGVAGDAKAGLRVFKARPRPNLVESYGAEFASQLEQAQPGVWQPFRTRDGWRAVRLKAITPPRPAVFEALRGPVLHDWRDALGSEQRTLAVRNLGKKYTVEYEKAPLAAQPQARREESP